MSTICPYCQQEAVLVSGDVIYQRRPDLRKLSFWQCKPCKAYVGCHKGSTAPLGRLANAALRKLKTRAHTVFDPIWKKDGIPRKNAYIWLSEQLGIDGKDCHIGMFDEPTCRRVIELCSAFRSTRFAVPLASLSD